MTTKLLKELNPLRVMEVADWMKIAVLIEGTFLDDDRSGKDKVISTYAKFERLLSRYEQLAKRPLEEWTFIGDKAWFKGFEKQDTSNSAINRECDVCIYPGLLPKKPRAITLKYRHDTIRDLCYHITKYNETATTPIEISVTEAFLNELL